MSGGDGEAMPSGLFPIVGIGASAGGLTPTVDLLRHLGSAPGVALVIVHHLDPTHESSLTGILARAAEIEVSTATDGARVQVNHAYVVPPNAGLLLEGGVLRVTPRPEGPRVHLPMREREVLQLLAEGASSKEIAKRLSLAVSTIETHRRQIADKLGLRSIAELTKFAIREGLTSVE